MIQLIAILLCSIMTNQTLQMFLQADKPKDYWVALAISIMLNSMSWIFVGTWDF